MTDFNSFYTVLATATLLGLLFIAVQPTVGRFAGDVQGRWKALATSAFQSYSLLLLVKIPSPQPSQE